MIPFSFFIKEYTTQFIRQFFINKNFHEVDTPTLMPYIPIEPNLYPLKTCWHQKNLKLYLSTSPESSLKKLIAQGLGNCFSISKVFRDLEDIGPTHNLEFSMLEWYEMDKTYLDIAQTTQQLVITVYHQILAKLNQPQTNILTYQSHQIDLTPPWPQATLSQLFQQFADINLSQNLTTDQIIATAAAKTTTLTVSLLGNRSILKSSSTKSNPNSPKTNLLSSLTILPNFLLYAFPAPILPASVNGLSSTLVVWKSAMPIPNLTTQIYCNKI